MPHGGDARKPRSHRHSVLRMSASFEPAVVGEITDEQFDRTFDIQPQRTVVQSKESFASGSRRRIDSSERRDPGVQRQPCVDLYSATKAAVRYFAGTWTMDLKKRKILVNPLSPVRLTHPPVTDWCGGQRVSGCWRTS